MPCERGSAQRPPGFVVGAAGGGGAGHGGGRGLGACAGPSPVTSCRAAGAGAALQRLRRPLPRLSPLPFPLTPPARRRPPPSRPLRLFPHSVPSSSPFFLPPSRPRRRRRPGPPAGGGARGSSQVRRPGRAGPGAPARAPRRRGGGRRRARPRGRAPASFPGLSRPAGPSRRRRVLLRPRLGRAKPSAPGWSPKQVPWPLSLFPRRARDAEVIPGAGGGFPPQVSGIRTPQNSQPASVAWRSRALPRCLPGALIPALPPQPSHLNSLCLG